MLGLGALLAINGKITIGSMIAANILIARALQPFDTMVGTWRQFIQARQSATRLNQLLQGEQESAAENEPEIQPQPMTQPESHHEKQHGHVLMQQLVVRLPHMERPVLDGISVELLPGQ